MTASRLRPLFTRTLRATLASPLLLAGCDGEGTENLTGYAAPACEDHQLAVTGLSPARAVDFVQLRGVLEYGAPDVGPQQKVSSTGTACASASDPAACASALEALTVRSGFGRSCSDICMSYYLATTQGDEVQAHDSLAALKTFLGPIDTPQEAVLLALANEYRVSCGSREYGAVKQVDAGTFHVIGTQGFACGAGTQVTQFVLEVSTTGEVKPVRSAVLARGSAGCAVGRRPEGLRESPPESRAGALGLHFAQSAHLEAASILAFLRLREELAHHGADAALCDAALASAMDEVLHTDVSTRLARRFGAEPPRPEVAERAPRPFMAMVLDNAVEGCTRETFGALVAHHQAAHAQDDEVRGALARIAEDETRHAELSWEIERWAWSRLSDAERAQVHAARRQAIAELREELARPVAPELVTHAGMPTPPVAQALLASLERELWA